MSSAGLPGLTVIVPVFNGAGWIGRCLRHVVAAARAADLQDVEVLVVDDGSTDGTAQEAEQALADSGYPLTVLRQDNGGRLLARRRGLDAARYPYVLFIDTRVMLDEDALAFALPRLAEPACLVWTSHVVAATEGNHLAGFWQAIEHVAWRRYFSRPRTMAFGAQEFDWFPKGTTALLAPRQLLIDAFDAYTSTVDDLRAANDDTALLRWVAARTPINISPFYASTYHARTTTAAFLRHAQHRGTVFVDGFLHPGTRFHRPLQAVLAVSPVVVVMAVRHPVRAVGAGVAGSVVAGVAARALGARSQDAAVLGLYAAPFGVAYLSGLWRGVFLRLRAGVRT